MHDPTRSLVPGGQRRVQNFRYSCNCLFSPALLTPRLAGDLNAEPNAPAKQGAKGRVGKARKRMHIDTQADAAPRPVEKRGLDDSACKPKPAKNQRLHSIQKVGPFGETESTKIKEIDIITFQLCILACVVLLEESLSSPLLSLQAATPQDHPMGMPAQHPQHPHSLPSSDSSAGFPPVHTPRQPLEGLVSPPGTVAFVHGGAGVGVFPSVGTPGLGLGEGDVCMESSEGPREVPAFRLARAHSLTQALRYRSEAAQQWGRRGDSLPGTAVKARPSLPGTAVKPPPPSHHVRSLHSHSRVSAGGDADVPMGEPWNPSDTPSCSATGAGGLTAAGEGASAERGQHPKAARTFAHPFPHISSQQGAAAAPLVQVRKCIPGPCGDSPPSSIPPQDRQSLFVPGAPTAFSAVGLTGRGGKAFLEPPAVQPPPTPLRGLREFPFDKSQGQQGDRLSSLYPSSPFPNANSLFYPQTAKGKVNPTDQCCSPPMTQGTKVAGELGGLRLWTPVAPHGGEGKGPMGRGGVGVGGGEFPFPRRVSPKAFGAAAFLQGAVVQATGVTGTQTVSATAVAALSCAQAESVVGQTVPRPTEVCPHVPAPSAPTDAFGNLPKNARTGKRLQRLPTVPLFSEGLKENMTEKDKENQEPGGVGGKGGFGGVSAFGSVFSGKSVEGGLFSFSSSQVGGAPPAPVWAASTFLLSGSSGVGGGVAFASSSSGAEGSQGGAVRGLSGQGGTFRQWGE
uniref:Uncharacterized protein n=1 Tax=Chromera velia CCMP2878 TaxID=1169474 RepID=A0A0G4I160_9ALVE|eukprot:Cvel_1648.t1-p1 / transcript=Cvel_1648.t1 / gene=Cvel_1648 / organism=Chromera_velia_CCMP2878 / gene_product=hypothetical protein / transcript_product=hypothetical protein / location=Cvel_scaffold59:106165-108369(-) / protein_length=735 / sequence_SO=supercontig / SO=protein_coding / is_pseudo=false